MLKTIKAKRINYVSPFGEHVFLNVPVVVEEDVSEKAFDPDRDDYALSAEVINTIEREMSKRWVKDQFFAKDEDGNFVRRNLIHPNEIEGIMSVLNVNASEFMYLIGYQSRGTLSKILKGDKPMGHTAVVTAIMLLLEELETKGFARKMLEGQLAKLDHKFMATNDDVAQLMPKKKRAYG